LAEAERSAEAAFDKAPHSWVVAMTLGSIYAARQRWENAIEMFTYATQLEPTKASGYQALALALYKGQGREFEAIEQLVRAMKTEPLSIQSYEYAGWIYGERGRHDAAAFWYAQAKQWKPDEDAAQILMGMNLLFQNKPLEAAQQFQAILARHPGNAVAREWLGRSYYEAMLYDRAIAELERARVLRANDMRCYLKLADAYREAGWLEKATVSYQKVLELDPTNTDAAQALQKLQSGGHK
jgi:tetratricopeptide (TPR) repeat protein